MEFTDAQQQAIDRVEDNLQLIACAGSGKTEVVGRRVVILLTSLREGGGGCTPANIVAFSHYVLCMLGQEASYKEPTGRRAIATLTNLGAATNVLRRN